MTNAIVNPWIFYLMSVCSSLKMLTIMVSVIGWAAIAIATLAISVETCVDGAPHDTRCLIKPVKNAVLPVAIATVFAILIPSKTTLMQMTVASYATPENVSNAYQVVLDVTNDLLGIAGK